jgi:hypothetical protein
MQHDELLQLDPHHKYVWILCAAHSCYVRPHYGPGDNSASNRNEYQEYLWYDMIYDDIYNRSWVDTQWQQYITHTQTVHIIQRKESWEVREVPYLCELYPSICLTTEEKAQKNLS